MTQSSKNIKKSAIFTNNTLRLKSTISRFVPFEIAWKVFHLTSHTFEVCTNFPFLVQCKRNILIDTYLCRKARSESKPQNLCTLHNLFVKKHNSKCMYNCFKKFLVYCSAPLEIDSCIRKGVTQMLISRHLWRQVKCHRITDYKPVVLFPLQSLESYYVVYK